MQICLYGFFAMLDWQPELSTSSCCKMLKLLCLQALCLLRKLECYRSARLLGSVVVSLTLLDAAALDRKA